MGLGRRDFLKLAAASGAGAGVLAKAASASAQTGKAKERVIILGFDGASPIFVEKWMAAGLLPNLAKLRASGTFAPIMTANPPQTPVSWAAFATGMNPGKTKLFDFLRRDPKTYIPTLALVTDSMNPLGLGDKNPMAAAAGAFVAGGVAGLVVKALYGVIKRRENPLALQKMFDPKVLAAVAGVGVLAGGGAGYFTKEYLPTEMPHVENDVQGQTFWQFLDAKGIPTTSCRVPARFPADRLEHGRAVAGLGVPDVRKTMGTFTYYTTEPLTLADSGDTEMGGKVVPLYFKPTTGETKTVVYGPINELFPTAKGETLDTTIDLKLTKVGSQLRVETPGSGWSTVLSVGEWSKPVTFPFKFNRFVGMEGYAKFYLLETSPEIKLYLQPISFHPKTMVVAHGPVRISTPQSLIGDLYDKYGPFKTLGWAADTWALNELRIPEEVFLEDMHEYVATYRQIMMDFIKSDEPLFVDVYSFTDRVAHMFWHHQDPKHPLYNAEAAAKYGNVMLEAYQLMDSIVGDVMKEIGDKAWFFVLSDHGFHSFRYAFNANTWLAQQGYIQSKVGATSTSRMMKLEDLFGHGQFFENVDWSRTRAYALGLGGLYINLKGREGQGIVDPSEYDALCAEIKAGLEGYVDPNTGEKPVYRVYQRDECYTGYDPNEMPDLRVANAEGFRASWQSSLGGITGSVCEPNLRKWSGDHCSYEPSITKGIFFCNRQLSRNDPNLMDFFPTVLKIFGYDAPAEIDGKSLV